MHAVDLDADLIPGKAAAGWQLGDNLAERLGQLSSVEEVVYSPGFHLVHAIDRNTGILVVRNYFPLDSGNTAVYFGANVVRFDFGPADELFCIWVFDGYPGRAFGQIGIGSPLASVREMFPLFWDGGDEMYYPDPDLSNDVPKGIAFAATEGDRDGTSPIYGICIHDWELMRRQERR